MSIRCLMNGVEVNYPCSRACDFFGDCLTVFESQKKVKPMTNGDRIRGMSDEELAKELGKRVDCAICPIIKGLCNVPCEDALLLWMKQPAEVDNG